MSLASTATTRWPRPKRAGVYFDGRRDVNFNVLSNELLEARRFDSYFVNTDVHDRKEYAPNAVDVVVEVALVPTLRSVTAAPATAAPEGSVTVPLTDPA